MNDDRNTGKVIRVTNHGIQDYFGFPVMMVQVEQFTEAEARKEQAKERAQRERVEARRKQSTDGQRNATATPKKDRPFLMTLEEFLNQPDDDE